jgi:hypothetical protein
MRNLRSRLAKLEDTARLPAGRCPHCPPPGPIPFLEVDRDGNLLSGEYPPRCARCGGPHGDDIRYIQVVVPAAREAEAVQP